MCAECATERTAPISGTVLGPDTRIPVSDPRAQTLRRPRFSATSILVGLNVLVFIAMALSGVPVMGGNTEQLLRWGANWGPYSLGAEPWRMLTSNYVHIGIIHIFFNMWCLWNLGQLLERIVDRWTYVLAYTACGIGGSLASLWWHPMVIGAGASGAIFGMAGLMIAIFYLGKLPISKQAIKPTLKSLVSFCAYNLLFGLVPGIDNSAHIGGLVTGLVLGAALAKTVTLPAEARLRSRGLIFAVVTAVLVVGTIFVKQQRADVLALGQGISASDAGNYEQALPALQKYAQANPNSAQAQFILGETYLRAHHPDEAISALQKGLKIVPIASAERELAMAYQAKGMQREADQAWQRANELEQKK